MTEEQRCGSCGHWERSKGMPTMRHEEGDEVYEGNKVVHVAGDWGHCKKVAEFGPRSGSDRFYVIDASEYSATLHTRADFGCVEWEAAP